MQILAPSVCVFRGGERGVGQVQRPRLILLKGPRPGLKFVSRPKEQVRDCSPRPKNSLDGFFLLILADEKVRKYCYLILLKVWIDRSTQ